MNEPWKADIRTLGFGLACKAIFLPNKGTKTDRQTEAAESKRKRGRGSTEYHVRSHADVEAFLEPTGRAKTTGLDCYLALPFESTLLLSTANKQASQAQTGRHIQRQTANK